MTTVSPDKDEVEPNENAATISFIREAVAQHLEAPFRSAEWLVLQVIDAIQGHLPPTAIAAMSPVDNPLLHEAETLRKIVAERVGPDYNDGIWRTCSGCHESEDGYDVGHYPHSLIFNCKLGGGCSECGGIGAIWDTTDYEAMGRELAAEVAGEPAPVDRLREALEPFARVARLRREYGYADKPDTIVCLSLADCEAALAALSSPEPDALCEDCPPVGYPTDKTRCTPCPRRSAK